MAIRVALHHKTSYRYDRSIQLSPHEVRLRPAAHARTPILSYSLTIEPEDHFINWQQDPYGNYIARLVFPEKAPELTITVDLVADMTVINPFDFFLEEYATEFPFAYQPALEFELGPYRVPEPAGPLLTGWLAATKEALLSKPIRTQDFLVALNCRVQADISYLVRMEPGVQSPEQTLEKRSGSCRDSAFLLVEILRHLGLAARFVSGYLIQLAPDIKALDGPSGAEKDFTDLHAWTEVYVPGAGWIGLDPTSGLLAGEGHIPLACTANTASAAPVTGFTEKAETEFEHVMTITRIHEDPRVTKPYSEEDWQAIDKLGKFVDTKLKAQDVRLTQGGEPTFVSIDDMDGAEWNTEANGTKKRELAGQLLRRLQSKFGPGGMLHYGQGKWYPGEPLPRWTLGAYWRIDGQPIWHDPALFAAEPCFDGYQNFNANRFAQLLCAKLGIKADFLIPAYEDVIKQIIIEQRLPVNIDPLQANLKDAEERRRLARLLEQGLGSVVGYVLPIEAEINHAAFTRWRSGAWPLRREQLFLLEGDSPMGLRLPLNSLPWEVRESSFDVDPFADQSPLPANEKGGGSERSSERSKEGATTQAKLHPEGFSTQAQANAGTTPIIAAQDAATPHAKGGKSSTGHIVSVIHTALCFETRGGRLHVFMPPIKRLEDYLQLVSKIEATAAELKMRLWLEGYPPPRDSRVRSFNVTPDPGVIEVNVQPAASWDELVHNTTILYEEARQTRLGTEKFMLDGRHTGTGGGNHATLGGATPADSPLLRRPDLLRSFLTFWQNHPSLSYLFSGTFIGPTSQAPRVDEARDDSLYELEIAFQQMDEVFPVGKDNLKPWMVDRMLRHLLVDLTGNTHRTEFSIDKLYSPDGPTGRLGLVEFRAFEMPPHARMSLVQNLLLRTLMAHFWRTPYREKLVHWGTALHDRWMLPQFVQQDIYEVVRELRRHGFAFETRWFDPFIEFRFPRYGTVSYQGLELELRQAIEPWHVLGEEMSSQGTARYVDSSVERLQIRVRGLTDTRHTVSCNGRILPLHPTGVAGEYVAAVRFRAWNPWSALHPSIGTHGPLTFDIIDNWSQRAIGGCTYHVVHPGGRSYDSFPVNANEAEARRFARFWSHGHTPGPVEVHTEPINPHFPLTLDLRRQA
jgi:uncharacterized protein (DUF2126 family)/transglutaminase-like putative cysteine protease